MIRITSSDNALYLTSSMWASDRVIDCNTPIDTIEHYKNLIVSNKWGLIFQLSDERTERSILTMLIILANLLDKHYNIMDNIPEIHGDVIIRVI